MDTFTLCFVGGIAIFVLGTCYGGFISYLAVTKYIGRSFIKDVLP
jgi:hypothetical protein